jgi:hypothetical protein
MTDDDQRLAQGLYTRTDSPGLPRGAAAMRDDERLATALYTKSPHPSSAGEVAPPTTHATTTPPSPVANTQTRLAESLYTKAPHPSSSAEGSPTTARPPTKEEALASQLYPKSTPAEKYELKLPEGFTTTPALTEFRQAAGELGLKGDGAQKLADMHFTALQQFSQQRETELEKEMSGWLETVEKDAEIGGAKLDESMKAARAVLDRFGTPGLMATLDHGWWSHPEVLRLLTRVGRELGAKGKP